MTRQIEKQKARVTMWSTLRRLSEEITWTNRPPWWTQKRMMLTKTQWSGTQSSKMNMRARILQQHRRPKTTFLFKEEGLLAVLLLRMRPRHRSQAAFRQTRLHKPSIKLTSSSALTMPLHPWSVSISWRTMIGILWGGMRNRWVTTSFSDNSLANTRRAWTVLYKRHWISQKPRKTPKH